MGLSDRSYMGAGDSQRGGAQARYDSSPFSIPGIRGLSGTAWLIILCVAVYVVDGFLKPTWDYVGEVAMQGVPESVLARPDLRETPIQEVRNSKGQTVAGIRYLTDGAGTVVGQREYRPMKPLEKFLYFSTDRALVHVAPGGGLEGFEFWRFIGFQFVHGSFLHILFNMMGLWFFGPVVEQVLGRKRFLAFYLLCGICGAIMYLLLNGLGTGGAMLFGDSVMKKIPFFIFNDRTAPLVGASAGVFGVLLAGAYLVPNATVLIYGILPMKLKTMAYLLVGIALFTVFTGGRNAGGEAAHIGGAIAGWYFIRHQHHLHGFFDFLGRADPTSRSRRKRRDSGVTPPATDEVDRILDKISRSGIASLTATERETLQRARR